MTRLWVLGGVLLALTLSALALHVPGALGIGSLTRKTWFVAITGISAAVYLLAVMLVTHRPLPRRGTWIVLLVAAALRLPLIISPAFLSTDVNRYIWDGRVQAAGINPYRFMPGDPILTGLRDDTIYPRINRAEYAPTIYPPVAQVIFAAVGCLWSSIAGFKATMVGFEIVTVFCLLRLLAAAALPPERVLIYAWNPLPVWAFAGNGHIDAAAIALLALALLLRLQRRDGLAGAAVGAAMLVKFLPAVVAPVLWRRSVRCRLAVAAGAVAAVFYLAYGIGGARVFGFLAGYGTEEGYDSGEGFWLLAGVSRLMPLSPLAASFYKLVAAMVLAGAAAWIAFVRRPDGAVALCAAAGAMMALLTFAVSPHYPWYFAWLAMPCVLASSPALLWLATAPILLYLDTFGDRFVWPSVVYVPAIGLAIAPAIVPMRGGLRRLLAAHWIKGTT